MKKKKRSIKEGEPQKGAGLIWCEGGECKKEGSCGTFPLMYRYVGIV